MPDSWFSETLYSRYFSFMNENWKLLSLCMFHRIKLILLIVSSPSRNFHRCAGCFQSNINIASRNTQNAGRKYHSLLKITHNKIIHGLMNKGKQNLNITISLSCWSVNGKSILNLVPVKSENPSGWPKSDLGIFFYRFHEKPIIITLHIT